MLEIYVILIYVTSAGALRKTLDRIRHTVTGPYSFIENHVRGSSEYIVLLSWAFSYYRNLSNVLTKLLSFRDKCSS